MTPGRTRKLQNCTRAGRTRKRQRWSRPGRTRIRLRCSRRQPEGCVFDAFLIAVSNSDGRENWRRIRNNICRYVFGEAEISKSISCVRVGFFCYGVRIRRRRNMHAYALRQLELAPTSWTHRRTVQTRAGCGNMVQLAASGFQRTENSAPYIFKCAPKHRFEVNHSISPLLNLIHWRNFDMAGNSKPSFPPPKNISPPDEIWRWSFAIGVLKIHSLSRYYDFPLTLDICPPYRNLLRLKPPTKIDNKYRPKGYARPPEKDVSTTWAHLHFIFRQSSATYVNQPQISVRTLIGYEMRSRIDVISPDANIA